MTKQEILQWFRDNRRYELLNNQYNWDTLNTDKGYVHIPEKDNPDRTFSVGDIIKFSIPEVQLYGEFAIMGFMKEHTIWRDVRLGHLRIVRLHRYTDTYPNDKTKYGCIKLKSKGEIKS